MIFWTVVGTWTGAWAYDRRQKRLTQEKWAKVVSHVAREILPADQLSRKFTIYLTTPPNDFVLTAREHFHEYVRPILAKSGLDWEAIEGRKEGDIRAQLAERIRKQRKRAGETSSEPLEEDDLEIQIDDIRQRMGQREAPEVGGDIVIGRTAWKEYVRGLHEGWLGPLDPPKLAEEVPPVGEGTKSDIKEQEAEQLAQLQKDRPHDLGTLPTYAAEQLTQKAADTLATTKTITDNTMTQNPDMPDTPLPPIEPTPEADKEKQESEEEKKKKKSKKQPPPYITPAEYASAPLSTNIPQELGPATIVPFPHILGFRNTSIRMYRFLNQRAVADDVGRQVAAAVLASYRPFETSSSSAEVTSDTHSDDDMDAPPTPWLPTQDTTAQWEQSRILEQEQGEWHKSLRKERDAAKESLYLDRMVIDPRIGERMRRFMLTQEDEERAERIYQGREGVKGEDSLEE